MWAGNRRETGSLGTAPSATQSRRCSHSGIAPGLTAVFSLYVGRFRRSREKRRRNEGRPRRGGSRSAGDRLASRVSWFVVGAPGTRELDSAEWPCPVDKQQERRQPGDAEKLADQVRDTWTLGLDPIPTMTELLEAKGLKVLTGALPDRGSGLTCLVKRPDGQGQDLPVIVVNHQVSLERRRLTLAHELAHRLIDRWDKAGRMRDAPLCLLGFCVAPPADGASRLLVGVLSRRPVGYGRRDGRHGSVATFGITRESPLGGPRYTANPNTLWISRV